MPTRSTPTELSYSLPDFDAVPVVAGTLGELLDTHPISSSHTGSSRQRESSQPETESESSPSLPPIRRCASVFYSRGTTGSPRRRRRGTPTGAPRRASPVQSDGSQTSGFASNPPRAVQEPTLRLPPSPLPPLPEPLNSIRAAYWEFRARAEYGVSPRIRAAASTVNLHRGSWRATVPVARLESRRFVEDTSSVDGRRLWNARLHEYLRIAMYQMGVPERQFMEVEADYEPLRQVWLIRYSAYVPDLENAVYESLQAPPTESPFTRSLRAAPSRVRIRPPSSPRADQLEARYTRGAPAATGSGAGGSHLPATVSPDEQRRQYWDDANRAFNEAYLREFDRIMRSDLVDELPGT